MVTLPKKGFASHAHMEFNSTTACFKNLLKNHRRCLSPVNACASYCRHKKRKIVGPYRHWHHAHFPSDRGMSYAGYVLCSLCMSETVEPGHSSPSERADLKDCRIGLVGLVKNRKSGFEINLDCLFEFKINKLCGSFRFGTCVCCFKVRR